MFPMQTLLIKFATLAVMFHMTFGCSWHHGLGGRHTCLSKNVTSLSKNVTSLGQAISSSCCDHGNPCSAQKGSDREKFPESDSLIDFHDDHSGGPGHGHFLCQDDHCTYVQTGSSFDYDVLFSLRLSLDEIVISSTETEWTSIDTLAQSRLFGSRLEMGVRAHLLLGVQIL